MEKTDFQNYILKFPQAENLVSLQKKLMACSLRLAAFGEF
jgi:hypothetical protein